jgi:hypothetical protein
MVRSARLALLIATLAAGCSRESTTPTVAAAPAIPLVADPWVVDAIESTGPRATLVAVLYPDRWTDVQARLGGPAPLLPAMFGTLISPDAEASQWPSQVLAGLGVEAPALPGSGWDRSRPLIFALAESPYDGPIGTIAATTPLRALAGLRHQVLVPASDVPALTSALVDAFGRKHGAPRPVASHPGAVVFTIPDHAPADRDDDEEREDHEPLESRGGGDWLAVIPETDRVRLVLVRGGVAPVGHFPDPALTGEPLQSSGAGVRTAGVAALASTPAIGVLLRPQRLPALRTWLGAHEGALSIAQVGADLEAEAERMSLRMLVGCERMFGDEVPEVEDWTLTLGGDPAALRLGLIASLTPRGAALVDAALATAAAPLALTRADAPVHLWLRFDLDAARTVLEAPRSLLDTGDDLAETMQQCGAWSLFIDPAAPFGASKRVAASMLAGAAVPVPPPVISSGTITQLALTGLSIEDPRGAIAIHASRALDAEGREAVTGLGEIVGAAVELHSEAEGSGHRTRIGFGLDPRGVFAAPVPSTDLAFIHVALGPVVAALDPLAPNLAAALRPHARLELMARRSGQALEAELVVGDAAPQLHDLTAHTWPAPAVPGSCSQSYAGALHRLLRAADDPALTATAAEPGLQAVDATLDCPELAAVAPTLRRVGRLILADTLADRARIDDARRLLGPACEAGDATVCAHLEGMQRGRVSPQVAVEPR